MFVRKGGRYRNSRVYFRMSCGLSTVYVYVCVCLCSGQFCETRRLYGKPRWDNRDADSFSRDAGYCRAHLSFVSPRVALRKVRSEPTMCALSSLSGNGLIPSSQFFYTLEPSHLTHPCPPGDRSRCNLTREKGNDPGNKEGNGEEQQHPLSYAPVVQR